MKQINDSPIVYTDEAMTQPYAQTTMPAHDLTLYAKWEAGMKTYQVRHYQQSIGNSEQYDLAETETVTAKTGEHLTLAVKAYEGFTAPKPVSYDVVDDGEITYVDYKYTRDRHQVTIYTITVMTARQKNLHMVRNGRKNHIVPVMHLQAGIQMQSLQKHLTEWFRLMTSHFMQNGMCRV